MSNSFEPNFSFGGFDEFQCFHISEFEKNDSIIVYTQDGKRRGVVLDTDPKSCFLLYDNGKTQETCHINDVAFLSGYEKGWC